MPLNNGVAVPFTSPLQVADGAATITLPMEKQCQGSVRYALAGSRKDVPVTNIYIGRDIAALLGLSAMPKAIEITIRPVN